MGRRKWQAGKLAQVPSVRPEGSFGKDSPQKSYGPPEERGAAIRQAASIGILMIPAKSISVMILFLFGFGGGCGYTILQEGGMPHKQSFSENQRQPEEGKLDPLLLFALRSVESADTTCFESQRYQDFLSSYVDDSDRIPITIELGGMSGVYNVMPVLTSLEAQVVFIGNYFPLIGCKIHILDLRQVIHVGSVKSVSIGIQPRDPQFWLPPWPPPPPPVPSGKGRAL